ncbi:50S ribosomal protein L3 [Patescibacteria group bacterium]|nr:50S ribosomal protein L3 [Patescibacteria group bacterium]
MKALLGKKIGMSRVFDQNGTAVPVTLVTAGPCTVTARKTNDKDGYLAVQLAYGLKKSKKGKKESIKDYAFVREWRTTQVDEAYELGKEVTAAVINKGDLVTVTSTSKGKGFMGVVKRYGFKGSPKTHGHKHDLRKPGSIGCAFPEHVLKGKKMAGRMGGGTVTVQNLAVIDVDPEKNLIALSGSIPGARNTYLKLIVTKSSEDKEGKSK